MHFLGTKEGAQPMGGISASDTSSSHHTYEAVKDEARLIQDSLLPGGTLRAPSFEVAYRYQPLAEVGGDFADSFQLTISGTIAPSVAKRPQTTATLPARLGERRRARSARAK